MTQLRDHEAEHYIRLLTDGLDKDGAQEHDDDEDARRQTDDE